MSDEFQHDAIHSKVLGDTGYWGRKGAGCILVSSTTGRVLLPKRSGLVLEPNTWGVFGGAVDPMEDERQAVIREVYEEAGKKVRIEDLSVLYVYRDEEAGFKYTTYLGLVEGEFFPLLNWETSKAVWMECGDWPSPLHYGLEAILSDPSSSEILYSTCKKYTQTDVEI